MNMNGNKVQVRVPLKVDEDGYVNRRCPRCHLDFKILWKGEDSQMTCPLCNHRDSFLHFSTPAQRQTIIEALQTTLLKRMNIRKEE